MNLSLNEYMWIEQYKNDIKERFIPELVSLGMSEQALREKTPEFINGCMYLKKWLENDKTGNI